MCGDNALAVPSGLFCDCVVNDVLPGLKGVLLVAAGVVQSFRGNEKPRVTRIVESEVLSKLVVLLQDMLKLRFDSLIILDGFSNIWSMVNVQWHCDA